MFFRERGIASVLTPLPGVHLPGPLPLLIHRLQLRKPAVVAQRWNENPQIALLGVMDMVRSRPELRVFPAHSPAELRQEQAAHQALEIPVSPRWQWGAVAGK